MTTLFCWSLKCIAALTNLSVAKNIKVYLSYVNKCIEYITRYRCFWFLRKIRCGHTKQTHRQTDRHTHTHRFSLSLLMSMTLCTPYLRAPKDHKYQSVDRFWKPIQLQLWNLWTASQTPEKIYCSCLVTEITSIWLPIPFANSTLCLSRKIGKCVWSDFRPN